MNLRVAAAIAGPLLWHNLLLPRLILSRRVRTVVNAAVAFGYARYFGGRPNWRSRCGLRHGLLWAGATGASYVVALRIPAVRTLVARRGEPMADVSTLEWVVVHIPFGTVYAEEMIFRATLNPLLDKAFGSTVGTGLGAAAFGLWHIHPARATGDSVPATVVFTAAAGVLFGLLGRRCASATAPALLHWAVNAGGVLAGYAARNSGGPDRSEPWRESPENDTLRR